MSNTIVTLENVKPGDKVVRGRDWDWGDQDSGKKYGIVSEGSHHARGWIWINWCRDDDTITHSRNGYRVGAQNRYDLYFYDDLESKTLDGRPKIKLDG